ncbi:MAG TPA: hypothetical protein PLJ08_00400 [Cyclobacteriaceae bacterium]|nr:hypothetical protein [Cyclobacteriaceae bacterium]
MAEFECSGSRLKKNMMATRFTNPKVKNFLVVDSWWLPGFWPLVKKLEGWGYALSLGAVVVVVALK